MRLVELFKVLGEKNRLRIVNILFDYDICVCELQDVLKISQVTASKNLAKLRDAGIVTTTRDAQRIYYKLTDEIKENHAFKELIHSYRDGEVFKSDLKQYKENIKEVHNYVCPRD